MVADIVVGYDETTGKHSVLYVDGYAREYNIQKKVINVKRKKVVTRFLSLTAGSQNAESGPPFFL